MISDEQYADIVETRARRPDVLAELARGRKRREVFDDGHGIFLLTADDAARGNLQIGANPVGLGNRRELLDRLAQALEHPAVDGIVATPDIVDDLLLLDALHDKLVLGSMNRSGLVGSAWEAADRFSSFDVPALVAGNLEGGKMTLRIDLTDSGTNEAIASCAAAIGELARAKKVALVEALAVFREGGRSRVANDPELVVRALSVAGGLGALSAYTWLKVPIVRDITQVLRATTMPVLISIGDPGSDDGETLGRWRAVLGLPQVRGFVAGRTLLYPADGDRDRAIRTAAEALGR